MFVPANHRLGVCLLLAAVNPLAAYAQGPLQPPGPPAPTMKSLDELHSALADINATQEKRIPITSVPVNITRPGSYYFIGSINFSGTTGNAITVTVSNVTIDLNGFTISSSPGVTGDAIRINNGLRNVAVKNGAIAGDTTVTVSGLPPNRAWGGTAGGFANGVNSPGAQTLNVRISDLSVSGCRADGIAAVDGAVIERVTASENAGRGINVGTATVTNCSASLNIAAGIVASAGAALNCTASDNGDNGIAAHTITNCSAYENGNNGLAGNAVSNSSAESNELDGIVVGDGTVTNCNASSNARDGISAANGVVAFCRARSNGQQNIDAAGATLTGNNANP